MITRTIRLQLLALLVIAVVGVGYVGFRYADLGRVFGATTYPVTLSLKDSGGIFTGADVTYRGVSVGRVGPLTLTGDGVDVQLDLDRGGPDIPADLNAAVRNLSAIGEQYVDLQPASDGGPVLASGTVIPASRVTVPVQVDELVGSLDGFVRSVPLDSLQTVVDELGRGFANTGVPLQRLLDTTDEFSRAAIEALPQTRDLLRDGRTVLTTQNDTAGQFADFASSLKLLAEQLKTSDPDLRRLIDTAPQAADQIRGLLRESGGGLSEVVANLLTVSRIAEPRQANLNQLLATYPGAVANSYTVAPNDGTAHLGLVLNVFDPVPCVAGYEGTPHRAGSDVSDIPANAKAYCAEPQGSPTNVRGAQNAPRQKDSTTPNAPATAGGNPSAEQPLPAGADGPVVPTLPLSTPAGILA
ncbi:MCE family protein [Pseudonocardia oroxyli]|uniref:Phospholipid/cholesterol/gamma-HCH transport system substrate-binding protein n=1 Tax=Pseudonocardia oroxyli TaxID=366584 RepID=A0A1G7GFE6_PSEOR|nr:MlaD family protein [Pseudonocardia oroxyli]SDE86867.1 phospholipid/cholesterol/gamma-HCH transport system substrate-binding protein [Pseudonocardia oroxyli]